MTIPQLNDYSMPLPHELPDNRVDWRPVAHRSVLLVHDMQDYFLRFYAHDSELIRALIGNLQRLISWCREHNIPVVYTAQPHQQTPAERALLTDMWGPGLTAADPQLQQIVTALQPDANDVVLTKWRYSAFQRSPLKKLMADWQRDQLLIGGIYAHIGCMTTALDAFMNDIQPFFVADALADFSATDHLMALNYVASRCGSVTTTEQVLATPAGHLNRDWLLSRIGQLVEGVSELDLDENLIYYGLDSIQVMTLAGELKAQGIALKFEELARTPTINSWLALIEQKLQAA
ncbi:MAG: isochorismatase family protein [Gammaproteobacteria bacterium]|nr:isochorismatase family protein [Gammaproteobacteria bacterium]